MSNPTEETIWQVDGEELLNLNEISHDLEPEIETAPAATTHIVSETTEETITPIQILEAMLFIGGPPITIEQIQKTIRGSTEAMIDDDLKLLATKYRKQNRPYTIQYREQGYRLVLKAQFIPLRERLHGSVREARLNQTSLDILSLVAYRQPIGKSDIEAIRGSECGSTLRTLVRLGLIAMSRRSEQEETLTTYVTTHRFLELFQLTSLDDLPRLGDTQKIL